MIKKILFIAFILFISISIDKILSFDSEVIIKTTDYEIITSIGFLLFLTASIILLCYFCFYILNTIFYPNLNKYKKKQAKCEQKFNEYINLITEGFIFKATKNTKEAFSRLKKANKIFQETNLSKLLESQIFYTKGDFDKSEKKFKEIKNKAINLDFITLTEKLKSAKNNNDLEKIQEYAEKIIKMEPTNSDALNSLLYSYTKQKEWEKANKILDISLKIGLITETKSKEHVLFLYTALGKYYYDNQEFFKAKTVLRKAYKIDAYYIQATILLIETYITLGKRLKAIDLIKKTWKNNPNPKLATLYFSLLSTKEADSIKPYKILYSLNTKSFEGNLFMAMGYLKEKIYSKARKYAKLAGEINETKTLYEVILQIEQEDGGSSAIISNIKQKLLKLKDSCWKCSICNREYIKWQPECNNCGSLDSLKWKE